jgi:hypothetical protein
MNSSLAGASKQKQTNSRGALASLELRGTEDNNEAEREEKGK